jgi:hypothetical protein
LIDSSYSSSFLCFLHPTKQVEAVKSKIIEAAARQQSLVTVHVAIASSSAPPLTVDSLLVYDAVLAWADSDYSLLISTLYEYDRRGGAVVLLPASVDQAPNSKTSVCVSSLWSFLV